MSRKQAAYVSGCRGLDTSKANARRRTVSRIRSVEICMRIRGPHSRFCSVIPAPWSRVCYLVSRIKDSEAAPHNLLFRALIAWYSLAGTSTMVQDAIDTSTCNCLVDLRTEMARFKYISVTELETMPHSMITSMCVFCTRRVLVADARAAWGTC